MESNLAGRPAPIHKVVLKLPAEDMNVAGYPFGKAPKTTMSRDFSLDEVSTLQLLNLQTCSD